MRMMIAAIAAAAALCAAEPANALEKDAVTPSGRAEMVFAFTPIADAVTAVGSKCMDRGWMVTQQTNNQVVCEIPLGMWQSALTQLMIGNRYSSDPKSFVRVSLAQTGEHTRVQTQVWAETQMAFGQMQHHQYQDDGTYNNMLGFLAEAGAQLPVGTTFNSTAYLGVDGENTTWQDGRRTRYGRRVTEVLPNTFGQSVGIQVGDIIGKINNRTMNDEAGFGTLLGRQRVGASMTVTLIRDGQPVTISGTARGRPTITALLRPTDIPAGENGVAMQMMVAIYGDQNTAFAQYRRAKGLPDPAAPVDETTAVAAAQMAVPPPETDLERMRREAAEAQARLAEAEARAASGD
jgi:membrane-associated protease RseP (regulator of RpoE activity)